MKKGLSPIVSAILILLIAISVTILAVIWLPRFTSGLLSMLGFNESYVRSRGCLSIENVDGLFGLFTIRNCGKVQLSDFKFFIDNKFINNLGIGTLQPSQSIDFYNQPITGGSHDLYITADNAESPYYHLDVPYWECVGGQPVLSEDWYISKNVSCICSYNSVIPLTALYVIGNGSLSFYNCNLRLNGYYSYLFVSDNSSLLMDKSIVTFAGSNKLMRILNGGYLNFTRSTEVGGTSVEFRDNSKVYLLNSYFNDGPTIQDQTNVTAINSNLGWPKIRSNIPQRLSVSNFNGRPSGSPITNYFKAENSNFTVNLNNVSFNYFAFEISDQSNTTVTNSYFYPFTIDSDFSHNLTVANFGTTFNDHFKAVGSNFELRGANLQPDSPNFNANDNSNNTIINSAFAGLSTQGGTTSYPTNTVINSTIYGNMYFSGSSKNTFINSILTDSGSDGWVIGDSWSGNNTIILNFSNTAVQNRISFPSSDLNPLFIGNITIFGNVTFISAYIADFSTNVTVNRYFPTIIRDSNNNPFPTVQPAVINITNYMNQSVWLGNVSGGTGTYYVDNPQIVFNYSNYGFGNFTMKVSQVCENITNITLLSNTSFEFTINKSYNYDGTIFSTQGNTGLSFDNSNFWTSTAGGTVYEYNKTWYNIFSFNSGLNELRDVSSNGTYLWLLNDNSTEKKVYRFLPSGTYNNWNFDISTVMEPYAVDFDGESFWVLGNTSVYKYNITGGYVSSFALSRLPGVYYGDIVSSNGNIWVLTENYSSSNGRGVFRYKTNGTYDNWYFDIAPTTTTGRGLAFNGTYFWVMNSSGNVFRYSLNRNCLDYMNNCDEFITSLPYTITKSNARYCLIYSLYLPGQTAITFASGVQNTSLYCQSYNIGGNGAANTTGINLTGANNNTINNCNINSFDNGIKISSSSNNLITNTNANANGAGIVVTSSSNNAVTNCSINGNINNDYYLANSGINNNFADTNFTDYRTIYFYDSSSWFNYRNYTSPLSFGRTDIGSIRTNGFTGAMFGSKFTLSESAIISKISYYGHTYSGSNASVAIYSDSGGPDALQAQSNNIFLPYNDAWNYFTLNAILSPGDYWLIVKCDNCYFAYDNGGTNQFVSKWYLGYFPNTFGSVDSWQNLNMSIFATYIPNIWLKTSISSQGQLTRKLINWNDTLMQWKDTFSNVSGSITARYNITGLPINTYYDVYNNSFFVYTLNSGPNSQINFTINLPANQEHEIIVNKSLTCSNLDVANKIYTLTSNVSSLGTCFNILANNVTLDCKGYTINYSISSTGYAVNNTGYNFTRIRNCNIVQNSSGNYNHSIAFVNANNGTIQNNTINVYSLDWGNNAVYLQGSSFNNITNNTMTVYTGANDVISVVYSYPLGSNYNTISNNILNAWSGWINGVYLLGNNNNKIINNIMNSQGSNDAGVGLTFETNAYIINNTFNTTGDAIFVGSWYNSVSEYNHTIQNNTQRGRPVYYYFNNNSIIIQNDNNIGQLFIANSNNITIRNVTLDKDGVTFGLTTNSTIQNSNITTDWNYGHGILFQSLSNNNTIMNNTMTTLASYADGVQISGSNSTLIQNNTIKTYGQDSNGINLAYSSFNTIKDNRIQINYQYSGTNPYISADVIQFTNSSGNTIYNNLFNESESSKNYFTSVVYSNDWNVTDQLGTRIYSPGTDIGGNYWTNSNGNGYSDTCVDYNKDGFCYNSYTLNSTGPNIDYMPLSTKYSANKNVLNIHFNESSGTVAYDLSGYGNNGTLHNGAAVCSNPPTSGCPTWVTGAYGSALSFDGINDYVSVPNSADLNISKMTVIAWIKLNNDTCQQGSNGGPGIVGDGVWGYLGTRSWEIRFNNCGSENGRIYFLVSTDGTENPIATSGSTFVTLNQWYQVAGVFNGTNALVFINGTLCGVSSQTIGTSIFNSNRPVLIGKATQGSYLNGTIDEVRIWNRALNQTEIQAEMNKG